MYVKAAAAAALLLRRRARKQKPQLWVHPINETREEFGKFHTLVKEPWQHPGKFYTYFPMDVETFDHLLSIIVLDITNRNMNSLQSQ